MIKRNEQSLSQMWDNIKWSNIRTIGVPEGEKREWGENGIWTNNGQKFPKFGGKQQHTDQKVIINSKMDQCKENHTQALTAKDQKQIFKVSRGQRHIKFTGQ